MAGLSLYESVQMYSTLLRIPLVLIYVYTFGRWSKRANGRPMNRVISDEVAYFVLSHLSVRQLQATSSTSLAEYMKWTKQRKVEPVVDDLGEGASLLWVGPRETENVIIYCHGGAFIAPLSDFSVEFWYLVQQGLRQSKNSKVGVAILQYSLHPASFPVQLNQLLMGIQHVMSLGVPTSKISLAGDSAGANLVLQLIGHILHPSNMAAQSPPSSSLTGFAGLCLISPWTMPSDVLQADDSFDLMPAKGMDLWTNTYLANVPESHLGYVQTDGISPAWFSGLNKVANRIQITAGRNEALYPSIVRFSETLEKSHGKVRFDVQEGGVHCDPFFDLAAKSTAPHPVVKQVTEWFAETLSPA